MKNVVRIRRFFAIFLLFSTVQGVISDYEKGHSIERDYTWCCSNDNNCIFPS